MIALIKKTGTALRMLVDGRGGQLGGRVRHNQFLFRIWFHRGRPFVYRREGIRYVCFPDSPDSRIVASSKFTDAVELNLLRKWLAPGDAFLDLGANLGTYAFAAAQFVGPRGRVVAVDAGEIVSQMLTDAARQLGHAHFELVTCAIGATDGTTTFFEGMSEGTSFIQSLNPTRAAGSIFRERTVTLLSLRTLAKQRIPALPAAVKLDIEGAEGDALDAAPPAWFAADGPLWLVEINPTALKTFHRSPAEIAARFPESAFERWLLPKEVHHQHGEGRLRPFTAAEPWTDSSYYNFFAVPRGSRFADRLVRVRPLLA
ncbi:MAG TPA: FkbM family methyltransferase [Opitutus sp.]|nr:FkbM family methyltransferase [Opitutus sp.]